MYPNYPACPKYTETLPPKLCLEEALSVRPGTTLVSKEVLSHVITETCSPLFGAESEAGEAGLGNTPHSQILAQRWVLLVFSVDYGVGTQTCDHQRVLRPLAPT